MIILALDTTTRAGSVAVLRGQTVLAELSGDPALPHGQRLPTDLARALESAHLDRADVDLFAVAVGPGSYTGMRVGIATVQGLAMATGTRVVPVSTLDALACAGANATRAIGAWMDAQRGEVYAALYAPDGATVLKPAVAAAPADLVDGWAPAIGPEGAVFIGDGAVRYRDTIEAALGTRASVTAPPPLAALVGRIAAAHPDRAVLPHALVPIYVRKPDVELARDRRSGA